MKRARITLAAILFALSFQVSAQVVPGDKPYQSLEDQGYNYIYSEDHAPFLPIVVQWNKWFTELYQKSYQWEFQQEAALILASGRNQVANGFATVIPHLKTQFYPSGFLLQDEFGVNSWFKVLLVHETAHLYQLSLKDELPALLHRVFGNALVVPTPIVVPIFIHPNVFLPTLMVEGNAVMNESMWGIGGRLHSGEVRALVYNQALNEQLKAERLLNDHLDFPYGNEKYLQGGYFFQYLAEKYGVDRANRFFKFQAEHFLNPLILNETFHKTFGSSYNQLFREYSRTLEIKAQGQRALPTSPFALAKFFSPLNSDDEEIFFLLQPEGKHYPQLWQIRKSDGVARYEEKDLASGKLFKTDRGWASATSARRQPNLIEYGLYLEGLIPHPDYRSQIVVDIRNGNTLSFNPITSFLQGQLYMNGDYLGPADSTAVLDKQGRAYYFLQEGDQRFLYRDLDKQFSFKGYYGKVTEVGPNGEVYFVASTDKGSSLYRWTPADKDPLSPARIEEVLPSDRIIEARLLSTDRALAVEVTSEGYEYKNARLQPRPAEIFYFENPLDQKLSLEEPALPPQALPESYKSLKELRYNFMNFYYLSTEEDGLMGQVDLNFSDPLDWNSVQLGYNRGTYFRDSAYFVYSNSRHQLGYQLAYIYDQDARTIGGRVTDYLYTNTALVGLNYPLFIRGRWSSRWSGQLRWENEDLYGAQDRETYAARNTLSLDWGVFYPLAYEAFRAFNLTLQHQTEALSSPFKKLDDIYSLSTSTQYDVGRETYLSLSYQASFSHAYNVYLDSGQLPSAINDDYYSRTVDREYRFNRLQLWELGVKKAMNQSFYFARWPISLRRWAPFVNVRHYDLKGNRSIPTAYWEYEYGAEMELLLIHKAPVRAAFSFYSADPEPLNSGWSFQLGTQIEF